jgi:hypothetical protein
MKIIKNEKEKLIPKEFEPVAAGFPFNWDKVRLSVSEREALGVLLSKKNVLDYFMAKKDAQSQFVFSKLLGYSIEEVITVKHHDGWTDKMIVSDGNKIRVPYSLIKFWPERLVRDVRVF